MDSQHQHVPADPSDHYGFLSYRPGERIDPVAEKRVDVEAPISKHQISNKFQ